MKRLILAVSVLLASQFCSAKDAKADWKDIVAKVPTVHAGVLYSIRDGGVNHSETFDVLNIKDLLFVEAGYAGDSNSSDHKVVLLASLAIKQLQLKNYITFPVLDLVEFRPSVYVGTGSINIQALDDSRMDYGVGATVLSYKF